MRSWWLALVLLLAGCADPDAGVRPFFQRCTRTLEATAAALEKAHSREEVLSAYAETGGSAVDELAQLRTTLARRDTFVMASPGSGLSGEVARLGGAAARLQKAAAGVLLKHPLDEDVVNAVASFASQVSKLELP